MRLCQHPLSMFKQSVYFGEPINSHRNLLKNKVRITYYRSNLDFCFQRADKHAVTACECFPEQPTYRSMKPPPSPPNYSYKMCFQAKLFFLCLFSFGDNMKLFSCFQLARCCHRTAIPHSKSNRPLDHRKPILWQLTSVYNYEVKLSTVNT